MEPRVPDLDQQLAERAARQKAELEERIRKMLEESKQRSIEWRKAHPKSR
jgi:uncharacterized NAD(P)/FAD-binding protein YdhS